MCRSYQRNLHSTGNFAFCFSVPISMVRFSHVCCKKIIRKRRAAIADKEIGYLENSSSETPTYVVDTEEVSLFFHFNLPPAGAVFHRRILKFFSLLGIISFSWSLRSDINDLFYSKNHLMYI